MMSLKKLATVAVLLLTVSVTAQAQGGGGGRGMGGGNPAEMMARQKEQLFKDITLDAAQTVKVDSIMTASQAKQREMMQAAMAGGDRQAMRGQMQELRTAQFKAIREVLTPAQQPQFDKNVEAMPAMGGRGRPPQR